MTDLKALLERVKAATGPDREIDLSIYEAAGCRANDLGMNRYWLWQDGQWAAMPSPTASIDAARAIIDRKLPGWHQASGTVGENDGPWACLTEPEGDCRDFTGSAPTEPLAIIEALLSALIAKETQP